MLSTKECYSPHHLWFIIAGVVSNAGMGIKSLNFRFSIFSALFRSCNWSYQSNKLFRKTIVPIHLLEPWANCLILCIFFLFFFVLTVQAANVYFEQWKKEYLSKLPVLKAYHTSWNFLLHVSNWRLSEIFKIYKYVGKVKKE